MTIGSESSERGAGAVQEPGADGWRHRAVMSDPVAGWGETREESAGVRAKGGLWAWGRA